MSRRTALLRGTGFVLAAALGIVGVWLIVTGNESKTVRIGAISAFWGLLLGTYAMFGTRPPGNRGTAVVPAAPVPPPSRELDLRQVGELERSAVAAARREFQQELQIMLRREVTDGFALEVAGLRAEVNALRNDLVEKVGGQLRLERIETTRLIGSDLEALQSELRKLRETNAEVEAVPAPAVASLPMAVAIPHVESASRDGQPEIHEAEVVAETVHVPAPEPAPAPPPHREPRTSGDPFADMPRITPFTDFALDPVPAPAQPDTSGRRHRADEGGNDVLARILAREQQ